MPINFLNKKDKEGKNEKATDRLAYMNASVPAWQTAQMSTRKTRSFSGLMDRFNGWVYASAQIIARSCSAQTIKLYSRRPANGAKALHPTGSVHSMKSAFLRGQLEAKPSTYVQRKAMAMQGDMVEVFDHPILTLLDNPSPEMDGYTLAIQRFLNLQLTGNAYLHPIISETLGVPIELWNMQSDMVSIIPDGQLDLVDHYDYGRLPNIVHFRKDEVLHEKQPNPSDPFYGRGWVSACLDAIDLLASMDNYEQNVLDNQARPDWAVMVKEHLTDSQYQRLMQQIEKQLGGKNNRSRPFIFEGGIDGKPMSFSPQDLAFASGEERKVEVIAAISGVPVSMLKANDPNLASAREGSLGFLRNTVRPYLVLDEQFLNRQLLPLFGQYADDLFLCYDDPVAIDKQMQATLDASDAAAGIRTRNEIRLERGLEPVVGGDELLVPAGSVPIDVAIEQARNPAPMFGAFSASNEETKAPKQCPEGSHYMPPDEDHPEGWCMQGETHPTYSMEKASDCVSSKISTLLAEGYPQDQAVAIAYSMCGKAKPKDEEEEKKPYSRKNEVDTKPTSEMAELAERGLRLREEYGRGGTEVGVARARDISNQANLSEETINRMVSFFARHRVDLDAASANPSHEDYPSAGVVAWLLWGGDPNNPDGAGHGWALRKQEEFNSEKTAKDCDCCRSSKKNITGRISAKYLYEKDRSLLGIKQAPVDTGNSAWEGMMKDNAPAMDAFRSELERIFRNQVTNFVDSGMTDLAIYNDHAISELETASAAFVREIMGRSGQAELDRIAPEGTDLKFDFLNPEIDNALQRYTSQLKDTLKNGTERDLKSRIDTGIRNGLSTEEIAESLFDTLRKDPKTGESSVYARAEMIARTEVALIHEEARFEAWKASGVVKYKQWQLSAGACESCIAASKLYGGEPIPLLQPFAGYGTPVGKINVWTPTGEGLMHAPLHPNCRCGTIEIFGDETELEMEYLKEAQQQATANRESL